ncbi:DNA polymerase I [Roseovarius sp. 217]|jgi:hypothetical protein|nr:DNA polymerase I [Roseovarius sp. 217]
MDAKSLKIIFGVEMGFRGIPDAGPGSLGFGAGFAILRLR